jgi:tetratricopeptide (TPR) repeat protein
MEVDVVRPPRYAEVQRTEKAPQIDEDDDVDFKPSLLQRMAKNTWARAAFRFIGVIGAAEGMREGINAYQEVGRQNEVQQEIVQTAYESSFDLEDAGIKFEHQIDPENTEVTFDDGDKLTGREVLDTLNQGMTEWANADYKGLFGITDDGIAEIKLADGSKGIDVLKLEWAYGDQMKSYHMDSPERAGMLRQATGLDEAEFDMIGKVYRDSTLERPDASAGGLLGLQYHDGGNFNVNDAPEGTTSKETHEQRLDDTLKIATEIIRSLDVADMSKDQQQSLTEALTDAIKETIEADNAWTQAVSFTENWGQDTVQRGFTAESTNAIHTERTTAPMIDRLIEADQEADLAWRKLAAMESDADGKVHSISEAIRDSLDAKSEAFFKQALELDPDAEAFKKGLEHFSGTENKVAGGG